MSVVKKKNPKLGVSLTDTPRKILFVGCGNIGSRHLQAVAKMKIPLNIEVVEPVPSALNVAKARLEEIPYNKENFKISWRNSLESLEDIKTASDLAIIATNSIGRVDIINKLLKMGHRRFLVEKMVCQSVREYEDLLKNMKKYNAKGWVDTARRYFKFYRETKTYFQDPKETIYMSIVAGNAGLGSNAIHYIDLFLWLANSQKISLNGDFLFNKLFENRRGAELKEFAGTIVGATPETQSIVTINFQPYASQPGTVTIVGNNKHIVISEGTGELFVLKGDEKLKTLRYAEEYSSNLTTAIASDIIEKDNCLLTTLEDSALLHYELFRIFNAHVKKITGQTVEKCPIT